jgi:hypothetical protein
MTYTYKLARRLAISRNLPVLSVLVLLAACAGDTTAPEVPATPSTPSVPNESVGFRVLPRTVTIETNQHIRFRAEVRSVRGLVSNPSTSWHATGGTINAKGTFSASTPGTYKVVGRGLERGRAHPHRPDTSVVVVVRYRPGLVGIEVTPRAPQLETGQTRKFTAVGELRDGTSVPIGVNWTATGGRIDAAGVYIAGSTPGIYHLIAADTRGRVADTVPVVISIPAAPDTVAVPAPDPTPAPSPTVARVVLKPATVFLATQAGHQFAAFGRTTEGDSVAIDVQFRATGGTITENGLYTAGTTSGTFRVIAASSELADTAVVTLASTSGGGTTDPAEMGTPMGLSGLLSSGVTSAYYTMSLDGYNAGTIIGRLTEARSKKLRVLMNMTGGHHDNYKTDGVFDMSKWRAKMATYNTPAIKAAVEAAVADGTIIGNSVMDEPANTSANNSWGPAGTMTKARVDGMCREVKAMFPTLSVGVVHDHRIFEPEKNYQYCDFILSQYRLAKGDVQSFRDGGLAFARRSGVAIAFSLNILHGGTQSTTCEKWGDDPHGNLCPMTGEQLRDWGLLLGNAGCALNMWRYEAAYFAKPEVQSALRTIAESLARLPRKPCRRGST